VILPENTQTKQLWRIAHAPPSRNIIFSGNVSIRSKISYEGDKAGDREKKKNKGAKAKLLVSSTKDVFSDINYVLSVPRRQDSEEEICSNVRCCS
jgi:hypothetical protein